MSYKTVDLRHELPGQPRSNINALELDRKRIRPREEAGPPRRASLWARLRRYRLLRSAPPRLGYGPTGTDLRRQRPHDTGSTRPSAPTGSSTIIRSGRTRSSSAATRTRCSGIAATTPEPTPATTPPSRCTCPRPRASRSRNERCGRSPSSSRTSCGGRGILREPTSKDTKR
jgi:hypothetical protein